jgi:hypothetical protein
MHFLLHPSTPLPALSESLKHHEQSPHPLSDLSLPEGAADPASILSSPALLLPLLEKKQWNLLTTDADFIHQLYEKKYPFPGTIILLLENPSDPSHARAIDRLFERYKRLSPRRLYTITPSRVKIRQLPGKL